jgi:hypothetical protein
VIEESISSGYSSKSLAMVDTEAKHTVCGWPPSRSLARPPAGDGRTFLPPLSQPSSSPLSPAAAAGVARRALPARCWRWQGGHYLCARRSSRGLLPAALRLGWRRSGSAVWFPRARVASGAAAQPLAAGRRACAGGRRHPLGPDLGPLGPIWVGAGRRFCTAAVLPGGGGDATAGYRWWRRSAGVLQRGWQGLRGPVWAWPG